PRVVLPLKVLQPDLLLAQPDRVFHVPAAEPDADQQLHAGPFRRVADEILLLAGLLVDHPDQPARLGAGLAPRRRPHPCRLVFPDLLPQRLALQADLAPGLLVEHSAVADQVVGPAGVFDVLRPGKAPPRTRYFADIKLLTQPGEETAGGPVRLVEGQPVEMQAVGHGAVVLLQGDLPLGAVM